MEKLLLALVISLLAAPAMGYNPKEVMVTGHELPAELQFVGVDENLGGHLSPELEFTNDRGELVTLGSLTLKDRPLLMAMVYYNCPSLCNYHLNGLTGTLKQLKWTAGSEFEVVMVSMDPTETPELAAKKKENYLKEYGRPQSSEGWHFLVGTTANVTELAKQLGFRYQWLEEKKEFAHASVAYVITPEGKISRYLHGIQPETQTLRLSLLEASNGRIGSLVEQALLFCLDFNPEKQKFTLYAWNLMRLGAVAMVLLLAAVVVPLWWRANLFDRT